MNLVGNPKNPVHFELGNNPIGIIFNQARHCIPDFLSKP
jgi:hypothetical protein